MIVSGTGISSPITVKVLPGCKAKTQLSYQWKKLANGNYSGTDRGSVSDIYDAEIQVYGKIAAIDELITAIQDNRGADNHILTLSTFSTTEYIFGADVDHTGNISATVIDFPRRKQSTLKGFGVTLTLRALSVSFTGSVAFPVLSYLDIGYDGDNNWTIDKYDDCSGNMSYVERDYDSGTFTGIFTLTVSQMQNLRRYIATTRTGNYTLSDTFGVDYPFGQRTSNSYPYTCKLIDWEDYGMWGLHWYKVKLKFAENN